MSEIVRDPQEQTEHESLLRMDLLFEASRHEHSAETVDGPARVHAVDQYIQWMADGSDMPLPIKRIMLAPLRREHVVADIVEAYVGYPDTRKSFVDADGRCQLIFMRVVNASGEAQRYLITPGRFIAFNNKEDLRVDPLLLELNEFSEQDPGAMFIVDPSLEMTAGSDEALSRLQLLSQIVRGYKLKAQQGYYPKAS